MPLPSPPKPKAGAKLPALVTKIATSDRVFDLSKPTRIESSVRTEPVEVQPTGLRQAQP
jgi:hypothetical protein